MRWILGIDAGGTGTRALLASTDLSLLRRSRSGPCNWTTLAWEQCLAAIDEAVSSLGEDLQPTTVDAVCICSAGFYPPTHGDGLSEAVHDRWPNACIRIDTDLVGAWAGALGCQAGIVVVSGTGSVAYGCIPGDREARSGGWGPLFDDAGSGYWLACKALAAVARWVDGRGDETILAAALCEQNTGPEETSSWLRSLLQESPARERISSFAPAVISSADSGDRVAVRLLDEAAAELGRMALAVERRLDVRGPLCWSWGGGLLSASPPLREGVQAWLDDHGSSLIARAPLGDPDQGALLLAAELLAARRGDTARLTSGEV